MKHPQTLAEELYKQFPTPKLREIKDNSCCVLTFMWVLGIEPEDAEAVIIVGRMIDAKVLDPDCTVYWDKVSRYLTGRGCQKQNADITSIKNIKERTPVYYERTYIDENGQKKTKGHWVGVEKGKIRFNSVVDSLCVAQGKPTQARILTFTGGTK